MDVQLLVPYQECLALLDLWLCGFLGDIGNWQCLSLHNSDSMDALFNVRSYYNQCIRSALTVYGRHLDGLWFDVVEELVIL